MKVIWDPEKAAANLRKHKVSFAEAQSVLVDERALTAEDRDAPGEQRYVTLGLSLQGRVLVVVYTYRDPDAIRIIAAWKAGGKERLRYAKRQG
jgi:uncharacterized protein